MATEATKQVLDESVDTPGVSIVTATRQAGDTSRKGVIYNPTHLAAAEPVWFHPMQNGAYLGCLARRWYDGIIGDGGPQSYVGATETTTPSWVIFHPATGAVSVVAEIPSRLFGTRVLRGATSRVGYLFTIGTLDGQAHLAHYRFTGTNDVILQGEEVLADQSEDAVSFSMGTYVGGAHLYVVGKGTSGNLYLARKKWGRIGIDDQFDARWRWQYKTEKGWENDSANLTPLVDTKGNLLTSTGPVSICRYRERQWMSTMDNGNAQVWSSLQMDTSGSWRREGDPVACDLLLLQAQLYYNPSQVPAEAKGGVPYLTVTDDETAGAQSIVVAWGLFAV